MASVLVFMVRLLFFLVFSECRSSRTSPLLMCLEYLSHLVQEDNEYFQNHIERNKKGLSETNHAFGANFRETDLKTSVDFFPNPYL